MPDSNCSKNNPKSGRAFATNLIFRSTIANRKIPVFVEGKPYIGESNLFCSIHKCNKTLPALANYHFPIISLTCRIFPFSLLYNNSSF